MSCRPSRKTCQDRFSYRLYKFQQTLIHLAKSPCPVHFAYLEPNLPHIGPLQGADICRSLLLCLTPSFLHSNLRLCRSSGRSHLLGHLSNSRHTWSHRARLRYLCLLCSFSVSSITPNIKFLLATATHLLSPNHQYPHLSKAYVCQTQKAPAPLKSSRPHD